MNQSLELQNQNLIEIANPVGRSNGENNDEKDKKVALAGDKEATSYTVVEKLRRMSLNWKLKAQTSEHVV